MTPTVLVVTTVHHPDDTRIRERLVSTLSVEFDVTYVTKSPGPMRTKGIDVIVLRGGRFVRWWRVLAILLRSHFSVVVLHDPELIPAGIVTRLLRRRPVVFDVHEDLSAQIDSKSWVPAIFKPSFKWLSRLLYKVADRLLDLTLAEPSYQRLFRREWPVFPNYPYVKVWPLVANEPDAPVIYVGDVTAERGVFDAVDAAAAAGKPLLIVGGASRGIEEELRARAVARGCELVMVGRKPNPEALELVARSAVGLSPLKPYPNYVNSLPSKILEYLCVGIPVVASDLPAVRSLVGDRAQVVLYPPGDVGALTEAIVAAAGGESRSRAAELASSVRNDFTWPAAEVRSYYKELISR